MADEVKTFNTVGGGTIQDEVARDSADAANEAIALLSGSVTGDYKSKINEIITKINAIGSDLQTLRNNVVKTTLENSQGWAVAVQNINNNTKKYAYALHTIGQLIKDNISNQNLTNGDYYIGEPNAHIFELNDVIYNNLFLNGYQEGDYDYPGIQAISDNSTRNINSLS